MKQTASHLDLRIPSNPTSNGRINEVFSIFTLNMLAPGNMFTHLVLNHFFYCNGPQDIRNQNILLVLRVTLSFESYPLSKWRINFFLFNFFMISHCL